MKIASIWPSRLVICCKRIKLNLFSPKEGEGSSDQIFLPVAKGYGCVKVLLFLFFNLEKSVVQRNQIACVKPPGGRVTTNQRKMKAHAYAFSTNHERRAESYWRAPSLQFGGMSCSGLSADSRGADICCQSDAI